MLELLLVSMEADYWFEISHDLLISTRMIVVTVDTSVYHFRWSVLHVLVGVDDL